MDNSLGTYKRKVEEMIEELKKFTDLLNHHVIIQPKETIEDAVRNGFPEDIAMQYLHKYYSRNESDAQDIIRYVNNEAVPYLNDVAFYIGNAMNRGGSFGNNGKSFNTRHSSNEKGAIISSYINSIKNNEYEFARALKIQQRSPMPTAEADKQNANPNYTPEYIEDADGEYFYYDGKMRRRKWWEKLFPDLKEVLDDLPRYKRNPKYKEEFHTNCATCALAYALRKRGFNVVAKGNIEGTLNRDISKMGIKYFDLWRNPDGSKAVPITTAAWAKKHGVSFMNQENYREYFEESCKEKGVYIVTVGWEKGGGHATILQREDDGILYFIEPQVYESDRTLSDGRRPLNDLVMHSPMIWYLSSDYGIMKVDDKIFDINYTSLFETRNG